MIYSKTFGNLGRLGNNLFQLASMKGLAAKYGTELLVPYWDCSKYFRGSFPFGTTPNDLKIIPLMENGFHYDKKYWDSIDWSKNVDIHSSYLQSEKYFEHCALIIREMFRFRQDIENEVQAFIDNTRKGQAISVHLRRTDYLLHPTTHPVQPLSYYQEAMAMFPGATFFVMSDDMKWARENIKGKDVVYSEYDEVRDLCLGSLCDHHIIANSSFSWWQGWLGSNPDKKVIAPKLWFGPAAGHDIKDLIPKNKNWITI